MATVRIYKVAELLNTSSQEVIALLKRDHGIEVKSASSTIEEVVARQFVDRLAQQRNIVLPTRGHLAATPLVEGEEQGAPPQTRGRGSRQTRRRPFCRRRGSSKPRSPRPPRSRKRRRWRPKRPSRPRR